MNTHDPTITPVPRSTIRTVGLRLFEHDDDPAIRSAPQGAIGLAGLVALDWEPDGWHAFDGKEDRRISRTAMLRERFEGCEVVVEAAHLHPRRYGASLAQVYTIEELAALRFRPLVFQQRERYKASRYAGMGALGEDGSWVADKDAKQRDAEAIWRYLTDHPRKLAALKRFELPGQERSRHLWDARDAYRAEMLADINQARYEAGSTNWEELALWSRIQGHVVRHYHQIPEDVRVGLGLDGCIRKGIEPLRAVIYTCWVMARDKDGNVRRGPDGRSFGWGFMRGAVGLSHSRVPNIARSQLTYHGMRNYMNRQAGKGVKGKEMTEEWRNRRRAEFTRYVRDLVRVFQTDDPAITYAPRKAPISVAGHISSKGGEA